MIHTPVSSQQVENTSYLSQHMIIQQKLRKILSLHKWKAYVTFEILT